MNKDENSLLQSIEQTMKLPRENGELVFHSPWESRVFAMAVLLSKKGMYPWGLFNREFAGGIKETESQHPEEDVVSAYYQLWAEALEKVLVDEKVLTEEQLKVRMEQFATGQRHHVC